VILILIAIIIIFTFYPRLGTVLAILSAIYLAVSKLKEMYRTRKIQADKPEKSDTGGNHA